MIARLTRSFCLFHPAYCAACRFLFATTDFNSYVAHTHATPLLSASYLPHRLCPPSLSLCGSYVTVSIAENAPQRRDGRLSAPERPGLGIEARREVLGRPVYVIEA